MRSRNHTLWCNLAGELAEIWQPSVSRRGDEADREDNLLKNAPHTADEVIRDDWQRPYSRERAAFPAPWVREAKFWPAVGRVDSAWGDRNLVCACPPMELYEEV